MSERTIEEERKRHAWLDKISGACSARTQANKTHLDCAYCAYLVRYYDDPCMRLQPRPRAEQP